MTINTPLRLFQTIFSATVLGLNGYVTAWYIEHTTVSAAPPATIVPIFIGGFTLLVIPYLFFNAPLLITHSQRTTNPRFFNKWVVLFLDITLCVLWFAGWIYEAVFRASLTLCYGYICGLMGWAAGLGAIASILFAVTSARASLHVIRTRGAEPEPDVQTHDAWVGMESKAQS